MKSPAKINHYISLGAINTLVQCSQLLFCFPAGWCSFPRVSCAACCAGSCKVVKEQSAVMCWISSLILLRCCSSIIVPPPPHYSIQKKGTSTHVLHSQHELKYAVLIALSLATTAADQTNVDRRTTVCLRCDLTASTFIYNSACFVFFVFFLLVNGTAPPL